MLDWIEITENTSKCRRNWTDEPVKQEDIDLIVKSCTNMPTRKNIIDYELFVVTDPTIIKYLFTISVDKGDFSLNPRAKYHNGQMMAPLILIWGHTISTSQYLESDITDGYEWTEKNVEVAHREPNMAGSSAETKSLHIGISAGVAGVVAQSLGYQTGYCGCVLNDEMLNFLKNYSDNISQFGLALGIGIGKHGVPRNHVFDNGNHVWTQAIYGNKKIKVHNI